jgi:putative oxidoreductase
MDFNGWLLSSNYLDLSLLLLRIFIGCCFVVHALGKLGIVGAGDMQGFVSWLSSLNIPFAPMQARLAMLAELVGGTFLTFGFLTKPAALILFFTMCVAGIIGHKGGGYLITNDPPGNEYTINLAVVMVVIACLGPGAYSFDYAFFG